MRRKQQQQAKYISLPVITSKSQDNNSSGFAANMKWLQANWRTYKDMWVALRHGELLFVADNEESSKSAMSTYENSKSILYLKVGRDFTSDEI